MSQERAAMRERGRPGEGGFSLVELMVAMVITLIVSGAIYGLMASGQNAFRREPEVADRQQNIRAAMSLIERDVINAGAGMPVTAQVFTIQDQGGGPCAGGLNGCGMPGAIGPANSDVLEFLATDDRCPHQSVCLPAPAPGTPGNFTTRERRTGCLAVPGFVLLTDATSNFVIQPATGFAPQPCQPGGGANNDGLALGAPQFGPVGPPAPAFNPPNAAPPPATPAVYLFPARIVRYRVAPDLTDGAPSLWRSQTGRFVVDAGGVNPMPDPDGTAAPAANWQLVARGIEDLQVQYLDGTGAWADSAPPLNVAGVLGTPRDLTSVVRQVRITLSARSLAPVLQGATPAGNPAAPQALRGQLTTDVTPRAAALALQIARVIE
jgi:prepilin-type N-terminal cleavage/methylation domain-containing protein